MELTDDTLSAIEAACRDGYPADAVMKQLVAEVRSLRALLAEADRLHRPREWHLYATIDCPAEECDPGSEEHQPSGCCITATYTVCAECVDQWREGMGDWLDVSEGTPPDDTLWPCYTHTALHPEGGQ